jgi:hypothetical protein
MKHFEVHFGYAFRRLSIIGIVKVQLELAHDCRHVLGHGLDNPLVVSTWDRIVAVGSYPNLSVAILSINSSGVTHNR